MPLNACLFESRIAQWLGVVHVAAGGNRRLQLAVKCGTIGFNPDLPG
jgi:hypothetical protein